MQEQAEKHNYFAQTPFPFTKIILHKPLAEDAWELAGSCPLCRVRLIGTVQKLQQKQREVILIIVAACIFFCPEASYCSGWVCRYCTKTRLPAISRMYGWV